MKVWQLIEKLQGLSEEDRDKDVMIYIAEWSDTDDVEQVDVWDDRVVIYPES